MKQPVPRACAVLVVLATCVVAGVSAFAPFGGAGTAPGIDRTRIQGAVDLVNRHFDTQWADAGLEPAAAADEIEVLRRLTLALVGSIPSLEEVRAFQADHRPDRLERWTAHLIQDWRFVEHFAEQFARALVPEVAGKFREHNRGRFVEWFGEELQRGRPYDELVRRMLADRGFWIDDPAVIFPAAELVAGEQAAERLAARTARAFLGQRMDCAQCHDHPFADWQQSQFEGLAAHFAPARISVMGLQDSGSNQLVIDDMRKQEQRTVDAQVPFAPEWVTADGPSRARLANWVTHAGNRRFRRATVNRVWGLMFGRAYFSPVDDLPDPSPTSGNGADPTRLLDLLGDELAAHDYDLNWLIQVIAASRPFRLASMHPLLESDAGADLVSEWWAAFPVTQFTPRQLLRSLRQASSIRTVRLREESTTYIYLTQLQRDKEFNERYGESGGLDEVRQTGSIPQAVVRLMGNETRRFSQPRIDTAAGRVALVSTDNTETLETCFLICLSRKPMEPERTHFAGQLEAARGGSRKRIIEDIFWTLFNSEEFNWNH